MRSPSALAVFKINDKLEFRWSLNRKIAGILALENAVHVRRRALEDVCLVRRIGHQATFGDVFAVRHNPRQPAPTGLVDDGLAMNEREGAGRRDDSDTWTCGNFSNGDFNFRIGMHPQGRDLNIQRLAQGLKRSEILLVVGIVLRVEQEAHAGHSGCHLLEKIERFADHRIVHKTEAGDIAARTSDARDVALRNGIVDDYENDRDGSGRRLQRRNRRGPVGQDNTSARVFTSSAASVCRRLRSPPAQRTSMRRLRPSVQPRSRSASRKAEKRAWLTWSFSLAPERTPIKRTPDSGEAAPAAPVAARAPARPRNSRRLMSASSFRRRHRIGSNECFDRAETGFATAT